MPRRLPPPAASISAASSSNERPSVPPAPAVFSRCSAQRSLSASASRMTSPARSIAGATSPVFAEPGCSTTARAPSASPARSDGDQRGQRLLADLRSSRAGVEQVDGVDERARRPRSPPCGLVERRDLLVGVDRRLPRARVLVEDLDRVARRARRRARRPWPDRRRGRRGRRCSMCLESYLDARPLRPLADRRPAHRRRAHRALQLADGARERRDARPAHRGHRPRALDAGERRADPRRAALARARLRRGPDLAGLAHRPPPGAARSSCSTRARPTGRTPTGDDVKAYKAAARRRPRLPRQAARPRARSACASPTRARRSSTTSSAATRVFQHVHLDDPVIARADGSALYNFAVAVDDLDAGITHVVRGEDHLSNTPKQLLVYEALGAPAARSTPTCRCCTAPTARSSPSATAPPRCRSCATPATCPRRCATTSRCSAGAPPTTRRSSPPTSSSRIRRRARAAQPGALRRAEAALDERPLPARADASTS